MPAPAYPRSTANAVAIAPATITRLRTTDTTCSWSWSGDESITTDAPIGYATSAYSWPARVMVPRAKVWSRIASKATGSLTTSVESPSTFESAYGTRRAGVSFCRSKTTTRAFSRGASVDANCCFSHGSTGYCGIARARRTDSRAFSSLFSSEVL